MSTSFTRHLPYCASFVLVFSLCFLLLTACGAAPLIATPPELTEQASAITQAKTGLAVFRAEQFQKNVPRGAHGWQPQKDTTSSTGVTLAALPDINGGYANAPINRSPQLDYRVRFVKTGTHYIWVYGQAPAKAPLNGDSLHVGIDGSAPTSSSSVGDFKQSYGWVNLKMSGGPATIYVARPGLHTLNVWMREDGARLSAIALSNNPRFRPNQSTIPVDTRPPTQTPSPVPTPDSPAQPINPTKPAFSASALRSSVGVTVHGTYTDTAYYDLDRILTYLKDLDIAWIRSGIKAQPSRPYLDFLQNVADAGIKLNLVVGEPKGLNGNFGTGDQDRLVAALKTIYAGKFHQLEGPNEWDANAKTASWPAELRSFYGAYRRAIRAEPTLDGIRFVGGSMAQAFNFPDYIDYNQEVGNIHPYPGGEIPEKGFIDNQLRDARISAGTNKPVVATELGYHNAVNSKDNHFGVSEDVAAHYIVRLLLYNYFKGVQQSYIYQLFDLRPRDPQRTDKEEWFGLVAVEGNPDRQFQSSWKLRKKPAYYALQRFLNYLNDTRAGVSLNATLPFEAVNLPKNALMVPIARNDGSYDIAVWLMNNLWDRHSRKALTDSTATATFRFASSADVSSFRPSVSDAITQLGKGVTELTVSVDGKVTFLRVRP